jgi:hypothetical protein
MRFLLSIKNNFTSFFKWFFREKREVLVQEDFQGIRYTGKFISDLPAEDDIEEGVIFIVGENGYEWLAAFTCPCGCGDLIQLNLLKDVKPGWRISRRNPQKISISPSIDREVGCKSHFTVINGEIKWWRG